MDREFSLLLVENNAGVAQHIKDALPPEVLSIRIRQISTFEEFCPEFESNTPDLVLAENDLAEFDVARALAWIRDTGNDTPLVLLAAQPTDEMILSGIKAGAEDVLDRDRMGTLVSAVRKILAKREAERLQQLARSHYELIAENTRDLICELNPDGQVTYVSPTFTQALNHHPDDIKGNAFISLINPEDVASFEKTRDNAALFRESRNVELRLRHANGDWQDIEASVSYLFDTQGNPDRLLIVAHDASDCKRAEWEIRKLAAFAQFNPNPVLEFAADGTLSYFNDAAMNLARQLKRDHPQNILPLNAGQIVKRCLSTNTSRLHLETNLLGHWLSWSFFPVQGNQVVHCYAEDITDSRNLEASLRQAQKMESVGQLAAGVAHDFNNILTVIQGHAMLMKAHPNLDDMLTQSVKQITAAAERACGLTRQLLMFSRKQVLQPQLLDLNDIIANINKMLRSMLGERITLKRDLAPELPGTYADPGMLEQILVNLAVNARDAIPDNNNGTITIGTSRVDIDEAYLQQNPQAKVGSFVCMSVTDTGSGMDEETRNRIFEPFFTTKEAGRGTGLGLATVYAIAKQHKGWVEVESQLGQGTTFKIFLPVTTKAVSKGANNDEIGAAGGHETILLVEDENILRELVHEILNKKGYKVLDAPNGVKALEIWRNHKDDIAMLLTDMMMPEGVSGKDLASQVLADKSDLKVVYTSGYSLDSVYPGFTSKRGQVFLQKPFHPDTLARAVRDCLTES